MTFQLPSLFNWVLEHCTRVVISTINSVHINVTNSCRVRFLRYTPLYLCDLLGFWFVVLSWNTPTDWSYHHLCWDILQECLKWVSVSGAQFCFIACISVAKEISLIKKVLNLSSLYLTFTWYIVMLVVIAIRQDYLLHVSVSRYHLTFSELICYHKTFYIMLSLVFCKQDKMLYIQWSMQRKNFLKKHFQSPVKITNSIFNRFSPNLYQG